MLETKKVDGMLVEEFVIKRIEEKGSSVRLGQKFWQNVHTRYGGECPTLATFECQTDGPDPINDKLWDVLDSATTADQKARNIEPLFGHLRFETLTEKDRRMLAHQYVG